jgi:hypothetical protein
MYSLSFLRYLVCVLGLTVMTAWAQEQARVLSSTPTLLPSNSINSNGEVVTYTAFNVVYEYAGKQYTVQMPNDPGPYVTLQITPTYSASTPAPPLPLHLKSFTCKVSHRC